eukprot:TRINITY_DN64346_c0_g1_i1.p2 TRINITY_DN64346_c0_g1~~TRINITY_DN64346_c0_g1_i1.p2  ORF type:complete len:148 (+),score=37.44 TRINITY_DN64346_c0_g1_i1:128-571(+)
MCIRDRTSLIGLGIEFDRFCCIYPTVPLLDPSTITKGFEIMDETQASGAFSVTTFAFPIFRGLRVNDGGTLEMIWPEHEFTRSNDLPEAYHDAGQFYWLQTQTFLESHRMYAADAVPIILPRHLVQDIDTPEAVSYTHLTLPTKRIV